MEDKTTARTARHDEVREALEAVGLPADATVEGLIEHHRNNAALAGAIEMQTMKDIELRELEGRLEATERQFIAALRHTLEPKTSPDLVDAICADVIHALAAARSSG